MRALLQLRLLAIALLAAAVAVSLQDPPLEVPTEDGKAYPSDWFGAQRAFPGDAVNQDAYLQALEQVRVERSALTTSATGPVWTEAGPFNIGGRVSGLAVAPGGSTVYLGAAAGGVWKSTDGGLNWDPIFDWVPSIGAVALDPTAPATVYVGTGEANAAVDNYDGAGLFRSTDGGLGWSYLGLQETRRIGRIAVDPSNPSRIFVAAMGSQYSTGPDRGLYRSENSGQTWSKVLFLNDSTGVCDVVVNPAHPETVFCASWERVRRPTYRRVYGPSCGIWRSVDHGTTWARLQSGLPTPSDDVGRIGLAIAASRPSVVYAQIQGGPSLGLNGLGLFRTMDGGANWIRRDQSGFTSSFGGFGWYFGDMAVDPTNPDKIYCLGVDLMRSIDGGVSFASIRGTAHVDEHAIWIDPGNPSRIYLGGDGGFYATTAGGPPWIPTDDLPITQFYAGTVDASNPSRLLGGSQDNGTSATTGSPTGWAPLNIGGDGFYCLVSPANSNNVFAEWQYGSSGTGPQRSTNGGTSFMAPVGFVGSERYNWSAPFVMDPSNPSVLLAASQRVYRSTNNGVSYSPISGDLTRNLASSLSYASTMSTLEIAPSNPSVYYAGTTDGKVWRSLNAGGSWDDITAGLPVRWVTRLTADPADANVVYVTLSGYSLDEFAPHVYRSTNAGDTWTPIDGNLPDVPANDILVDPANSSRLYLATDAGVFTTQDLGSHWYLLGLGLPPVPAVDLTLHAASRTLVVATHGRSQWKLDLGQLAVAVSDAPATARLELRGPIPNPSGGEVRFAMEVSHPGRIRASIYDALGRRIATVLDAPVDASRRTLTWDGRDRDGHRVAAGSYYLRVGFEDGSAITRRIVRLD